MPLRWRAIPLLLLVAGCAHESPPEPVLGALDSIMDVTPPTRLTLNAGADGAPAFTRDGRSFWYSWERIDRADHDLCLGLLPLHGGTRRREVCHTTPAANPDSLNWYVWAAPHPDGRRVAWFRLSSSRASPLSFPFAGEVVIAPLADSGGELAVTPLHIFPFLVAPGHYHFQPEHLQWVNDSTLIYLAVLTAVEFGQALPQDTLHTGIEIGTLTISGGSATLGYIPGTDQASGAWVTPDGKVWFTLNNDNRIYRTNLSGVPIDTVYDLGPGTLVARDAAIADTAAYVIVDGDVTDRFLANIGNIQADAGGPLWRVSTLGRTLLDSTRRWRHPTLSPDGHTLLIEGADKNTGKTDLFSMRIN